MYMNDIKIFAKNEINKKKKNTKKKKPNQKPVYKR